MPVPPNDVAGKRQVCYPIGQVRQFDPTKEPQRSSGGLSENFFNKDGIPWKLSIENSFVRL